MFSITTLRQKFNDLIDFTGEVGKQVLGAEPNLIAILTGHRGPLAHSDPGGKLETPRRYVRGEAVRARYWYDTDDEPDRKERRMAECLAHQVVPWEAFEAIVTKNDQRKQQVQEILADLGQSIPVATRPDWYF